MEDEATQPTQDPRRIGRNNSGLADEDISDVLCILHPCSPAAFRIVAHTAQRSPQNVLQTNSFDDYDDEVSQAVLEEQETFILGSSSSAQAMDLALRFSARVIRPHMGFVFGRNAAACDVVLDTDTVKRVSNFHFRIFVNESGVLMLADMSTNGTIVDDVVLRSKQQSGTQTRMLNGGSIIQILSPKPEEIIKFIVRIPNREGHIGEFQAKFQDYMRRVAVAEANARRQEDQATQVAHRLRPAQDVTQTGVAKLPITSNYFGMHWSGGEKYNVVGQIGKGAFAMVYQLATKSDGQLFAAKELEKRRFMKNGILDRKIDNEMQIMKAISHRNVVQYIEYEDVGNHLYIIMEFVPCGDLQQYLQPNHPLARPRALVEPLAKRMSAQVFDALDYLHGKKITHRDIKPDNILIADVDPHNFTIKLSDFGLSKVVKDNETFLKTFCGTLLYCAPEVFPHYDAHLAGKGGKKRPRRSNSAQKQFHSYSQSVDVWSYGAVLWYALCLQPPFEGVADNTGRGMFDKIMMTPLDPTVLSKQGISTEAVALLVDMLNTDPAARPTPAQCLSHPWFGHSQQARPGATELISDNGLPAIAEEHEHDPDFANLSLDERESGQNSQTSEVSFNSGDLQFFDPRKSKRLKSDIFAYRNPDGSFVQSSPEVLFDDIPIMQEDAAAKPPPERRAQPKLFGEISHAALESSSVFPVKATVDGGNHPARSQELGDDDSVNSAQSRSGRGALASPSLLGAESLVRDLHMHSPNHSGSSPSGEPNEPTTPNTPSRPRPQTADRQAPNDITPKPLHHPTFSRQIKLEITPSFYYDPLDPSTHNPEYASKVSGLDFLAKPSYLVARNKSMPETNNGSLTDKDDDQYHTEDDCGLDEEPQSESKPSPPAEFVKPPPRLGKLVSTSDSYTPNGPITLNLSSQFTSWGRADNSTIVYPDKHDTRIGKRALMLWFHAKGINKYPEGDDSWLKLPDLHCVIATESSAGIFINGVHLKKREPGRSQFGRVYTGDEIVVWKDNKVGLRFTCEFFHGEGKERRPDGAPRFRIETENPPVAKSSGDRNEREGVPLMSSGALPAPAA